MASFLTLPPIDTSLGMLDEQPARRIIRRTVSQAARRTALPRITTSFILPEAENTQDTLASAVAAVADALGVSAHDFRDSDSTPTQMPSTAVHRSTSTSSSVYLPAIDFAWSSPSDESIEQLLSMAVATTLGLDGNQIPRDESFLDLGGDQRTARQLRNNCRQAGLSVKTKDILNCKTMAELETHITPLSMSKPVAHTMPPYIVSPLTLSPPVGSLNAALSTSPSQSPCPAPSLSVAPRNPNRTHLQPKSSKRYHNKVEHVLSLNSDVSKAAVLKPKAGLFEGQVVAFITLSSCVIEGSKDYEIRLLNDYYNSQLPAIQKAMENKVAPSMIPKIWCLIERMPVDDFGRISRRRLQTWIQNANEALYRQITSAGSQAILAAPATDVEQRLQKVVSKVLNIEQQTIGMNLSFLKLGGDSATATQVVVRCKSQGLAFNVDDVVKSNSLAHLASLATSSEVLARRSIENAAEEFDLSPMQRFYFHTALGGRTQPRLQRNGSYRFNQSMLLRFKSLTGIDEVRAAVEAVVGHHSMLRTLFRRSGESWAQHTLSDIPSSYHFGHHVVGTNEDVEEVIHHAQGSIDIENGPVFAAHHFHTHDGHQMLYLVAHHLVVDLKSWRVIADDLDELLVDGNLVSGRALSFQEWTAQQRKRVQQHPGPAKTLPFNVNAANWEYWGVNEASNNYGNTASASFSLGPEITSILTGSNRALRTDSSDIFMAGLLLSFCRTFRDRATPAIWNQEHERALLDTELDVSETVGWFTSLCPLALGVSPSDDFVKVLCHVKDARRAVADRGIPYFAANLTNAESAEAFTSSLCPLEIIFTYAGCVQSLDRQEGLLEQLPVPGRSLASKTSDIGTSVGRIALFEVSVAIDHGETKFKFLFHRDSKHQDLIKTWIRSYQTLLRESILRLQNQSSELSRSDIPMIDLTYEGLNKLNHVVLPGLGIEISDIENIYPVSANQQNWLIGESLVPGSGSSQVIYELTTLGSFVDIGRLCAAWQQVAQEFSALRTIFFESVSRYGLFDQVILKRHSPNMLFIECGHGDAALFALEGLAPLVPGKGTPAHRLVVCQAPGKTLLKVEASQALCDAASLAIIIEALEQAYFSEAPSKALEISYPEYLQCLKTTPCSMEFWRELLRDAEPCHIPSLLSKRLNAQEYEYSSIDLGVRHDLLERFARKYHLDMAAVLRVAWSLVLRAFVGTETVCFGYRTSGRDIPVQGLDRAVGSFSTVLICNLAVHSSQFLAQLLMESDETHREALHHQHVSVNNIHHALKIRGDSLFNTCLSFGYENIPESQTSSKFRFIKSMHSSEYDMNVDCSFKNGKIAVDIGQRIFSSAQVENIAHAFGRAIESILEVPDAMVKDVDLFSEHDHKQILAWNSQQRIESSGELVHELIARQAAQNPDIQAVCAWDGELTYGELDGLARTLASYLANTGLSSGVPVPVIVDKSRWAVVAMLAVLKAGAILVPVDAAETSMIPWVINSVGSKAVLASESVRGQLDLLDCEVFYLNESAISYMAANPVPMVSPETRSLETSVILFRSGGAKNHKGVTYSHGALATACIGQGPALRINPSSRVMQLSSYGVDIALSEIFTTLVHGGCVCVPSAAERIEGFTHAAQRMNVNWTYLTPTLSRKLQPESLPDLAVVCFRTRQLDDDTFGPWVGKAKVLLAYGSAEACPLGLSASEVRDSTTVRCIGAPFCGNFWIVNPEDSNRLMPVGAVGELVVGAPTLAHGFELKNRESKDASAISPTEKPSQLLKTGHMVRYRESGQIELVSAEGGKTEIDGRTFQPSEIEPRLRRCLGRGVDVIVETIAFNYRDGDSAPILAAFVELGESLFHGEQDLMKLSVITKERLYLAKRMTTMALRDVLPRQMIPTAFIPVRKMPLTSSLKVSRRELQKMIMGLSKSQLLGLADVPNPHEVQAACLNPLPFTITEQRVRAMCSKVLEIHESSITANDGFITLGGDNDLAHDLVIACREQGISISIVDILRNLTLSELCRGVTASNMPADSADQDTLMTPSPSNAFVDDVILPQVGFSRESIEDVAEASALQAMFIESGMLRSKGNVNYFVMNVSGALDWGKLENACLLLTAAHPILRTVFASSHRQLFQTVLRSYQPDFQRYQCPTWRLGNLATKLIKRDQATPIDFRKPITKFSFLDSGKSSILMIRLSRAQYNDVSLPTILKDLSQLYDQGELSTKHVGFCDMVRAAQNASHHGSVDYWRTLLAGASMTQVIAQPTPVTASSNSKTIHQQIPTGSVQNLGIPFETILKGAWSVVLSNLSGSDDVVFGQLIDGKHLTLPSGHAVSDIVGPAGNIIPVRTKLPSIPITPYEYFRGIQSQYVASVPHENMQFTDIVKKSTNWPTWTRFSTVVQHQNQSEREDLSHLTIGGSACKLSCVESNHQNSDIFVRSVNRGSTHVSISLTFCEKRMHPFFADEVLRVLCSTISLLTSAFVMEPLALKGLNDTNDTPKIPMPSYERVAQPTSATHSVSPDHAGAIHTVISSAWDTILDAQILRVPDVRSVPFYKIWGSLIPAGELARYYTEQMPQLRLPGLETATFTAEDIIDNPTMMTQYEMIISKQQGQQTKRSSMFVNRSSSAFGKNIRRLASPTATPASPITPRHSHSRSQGSSGDSSVDSMTTGSSNSDTDELKDEVSPLSPLALAQRKRIGTGLMSLDASTMKKRSSVILGKMRIGATGA